MRGEARSILFFYLAATPLFAIIDWLLGWNIRVVGVESPAVRVGYYAGLLALGAAAWWRPALQPILVLVESALNVSLIIIRFAVDSLIITDIDGFEPPSLPQIVGFLIAGGFGIVAFNRAQAALRP